MDSPKGRFTDKVGSRREKVVFFVHFMRSHSSYIRYSLHLWWPLWDLFRLGVQGYTCARGCFLHSHFAKSRYHKWMLNFIEWSFCICWYDHMIFIFHFVYVVYYINWFVNTESTLHPRSKLYLIVVYDFFNVLLDSVFADIFLRIFHLCSSGCEVWL